MKCDVILAGVGGQGVLSVAAIIAQSAANEGFNVRQSEVHGMAQRGGAVLAHMRISSDLIASDLVPKGAADIILSMEPLESLRYAAWLAPSGILISASDPFINISNYPLMEEILNSIKCFPSWRLIEAVSLAKEAGLERAVNTVMVGAASPFLPVKFETLEKTVKNVFAKKGEAVLNANEKALLLGRNASK